MCPIIYVQYACTVCYVFMCLRVVHMCIVLTTYVHMYSNYGLYDILVVYHVFCDH